MEARQESDRATEMEEDTGERSQQSSALEPTREHRPGTREWFRNGWVVRETVAILKVAAPMVVTNFFYQVMFTVALVFVGNHSGRSLELDAAALALSFMNVTGVSVGQGLSTAAETLCAQMYGFKNYKGLGVVTQRGVWILGLALFPILIIWLNTESLLLFLQQDPCVARLTAAYVKIFASALPALFLFFMLQRYLVAQSVVVLFILVGVLNNVVSAALHGLFMYGIDMGIEGSSLSLALATMTSPLLLLLYIRLRKSPHQTWGGWSLDGLRGWTQFFRLGVPGVLMVCFEWWCFELAAFVTGSISNTQLAINIITIQILSLNFMVPFGVSMALTVRVGNELGAGNPQRAKRATYSAFGITLVQSAITMVILAGSRSVLGRIFTRDEEVIKGVGEVMLVAVPLVLSDSLQGMMQGVLRGTGKQLAGAVVNFVSYYIIGFPIGVTLAITAGMGALGMWLGLLAGSITQMTCFMVLVIRVKWDKESLEAIRRAQSTSNSTDAQSDISSVSTVVNDGEEEGEGEGERLVFRDFTATNDDDDGPPASKKTGEPHSRVAIEELPLIATNENEEEEEEEKLAVEDGKLVADFSPQATGHESESITVSNGRSLKNFNKQVVRQLNRQGNGCGWSKFSPNSRLVLHRSALLVVCVLLLVLGGLASHYRPHRPPSAYCSCTHHVSGNSTAVCENGNGTTVEQDPVFGTGTVSPNPSTINYPGSTHLTMTPTPTPLSSRSK